MHYEIRGARQFARVEGHSESPSKNGAAPALLLHGVPDTHHLWDDVFPALTQRYRCYAPDLPGFGDSAPLVDQDFSLEGYAALVDDMLDALGITEPLTLVLHDWGGIIGYCWACRNPQRIERIVCGSFPFFHLYRWHFWARVWRTPLLGELSMLAMNRLLFSHEIRRGSRKLDDAHIRKAYIPASQRHTQQTVLRLYRSADPDKWISWEPLVRQLGEQVPITVLWGEEDPYVPTWMTRFLGSEDIHILPGIGHWVPAEAPETYAAAVLDT